MKKMTKLALLLAASVFATSSLVSCYSGSDDNESWVDGGHSKAYEVTFDMLKQKDTNGTILDKDMLGPQKKASVTSVEAAGDSNITASVSGKKVTFTNAIAKNKYVAGKNDDGTVAIKIGLAGLDKLSTYTQTVILQVVVPVDELGYINESKIKTTLLPSAPSTGKFTISGTDVGKVAKEKEFSKVATEEKNGYYIPTDTIVIMENNFYFYAKTSDSSKDTKQVIVIPEVDSTSGYLKIQGGGRVDKSHIKFPVQGACTVTVKYFAYGSKASTLAKLDESELSGSATQSLTAVTGATEAPSSGTVSSLATASFEVKKAQDVYIGGTQAIGIASITIDYGN